jgi:excisionase family DNA binding protein
MYNSRYNDIKNMKAEAVEDLSEKYMSSSEAALTLNIHIDTVSRLAREGQIPAQMLARRWFIHRSFVEEMARTYVGKRGRPRIKRRYTKRRLI